MILFYLIVLVSAIPNHWIYDVSVGPLTIAEWLGLLALLYACLRLVVRKTAPPFLGAWAARLFLLLVAMAVISCVVRGQDFRRFSPLAMYAKFLGLFFITLVVVDSAKKLRYTLLATVAAIALASAYVLREYQKVGIPWYRPGWVAGDSNSFATVSLLAIPVALFLLRTKLPLWQRLFCFGCLALTLPAFAVAASRGAYVGLAVMLLYLLLRSKRRAWLAALTVALLALSLYLPSNPLKRFLSPQYADRQSVQIHLLLWHTAARMIQAHPIAGIGLGRFKPLMMEYAPPGLDTARMAHNVYLEYAAELGLLAPIVFLGILIGSWVALEKVRRRAWACQDFFFFHSASGMQAGLLGFAVAANFMPADYLKPFWILAFVCSCTPRLFAASCSTQTHAPTGRVAVEDEILENEPVGEHEMFDSSWIPQPGGRL